MRIFLLNDDSLPTARGGAAVIVDALQKQYIAKGHDAILITTHQDKTKDPIERSANRISIYTDYPLVSRHRHCLHDPQISKTLRSIFAELKPAAIHAHNIHTYLTYEALTIASEFTENIILTAHDTFLVSFERVHGKRYEKLASQHKPMKMHWWEHMKIGRKYWPLRNRSIRKILKESATKVIAISDAVAAFLNANSIPTTATIANGIKIPSPPDQAAIEAFRTRYGIKGPTVLFVGRIRKDKGIQALLDAAENVLTEIPNAQFVINGAMEDLEPFLNTVSKKVRQTIIATGWLSREDTMISYASSTVVTVPSLYLDNFPTTNLEAMAFKKPVVGTIFGGTPEIVINKSTGIIVNPRQTAQYANALVKLLKNTEQATVFGIKGYERVRDMFSLEQQCEKYLQLMEVSSNNMQQ